VLQHPSKDDVRQVEQETYNLLDEIGMPYKRVSGHEWVERVGTAVWVGESETAGRVGIYLGCTAGAVAHEIGHGFHEALNFNKREPLPAPFRYPEDGEAVAEAVRFFVERRLGTDWAPTSDKEVLERVGWELNTFKGWLKTLVKADAVAGGVGG
jgi:hypothetical protein